MGGPDLGAAAVATPLYSFAPGCSGDQFLVSMKILRQSGSRAPQRQRHGEKPEKPYGRWKSIRITKIQSTFEKYSCFYTEESTTKLENSFSIEHLYLSQKFCILCIRFDFHLRKVRSKCSRDGCKHEVSKNMLFAFPCPIMESIS